MAALSDEISIDELVSTIEAALAGSASVQDLDTVLRHHKQSLANPLKHVGKDPTDRGKVQSGRVAFGRENRVLTPDFIKVAVELSDKLDINEVQAVELIQVSVKQQARYGNQYLRTALQLYHHDRQQLLNALLALWKSRAYENVPEDIRACVTRFTNEVASDGTWATNMLSYIVQLNALEIAADFHPRVRVQNRNRERLLVAEILFTTFYTIQMRPQFAGKMLETLQGISARIAPTVQDLDANLVQVAYVLMLTLLGAIEPAHETVNPQTGDAVPNALVSKEFLMEMQKFTLRDWPHDGFQGCVQLSTGLLLCSEEAKTNRIASETTSEDYINKALGEKKVFAFLTENVLTNPIFSSDSSNREVYAGVLHELISSFLVSQQRRIRKLKHTDEENTRTHSLDTATSQDLRDLLRLIAVLHYDLPDLAVNFWISPALGEFVRAMGEPLTSSMVVPYLNMLAALSCSSDCALRCHEFLESVSTARSVSWRSFLSLLARMHEGMQETDGRPALELSAEDAEGLTATLRLMQRVLSFSEPARQSVYDNPHWTARESLFGLLRCAVSPALKAELLLTIAAFAKSPEIAGQLWLLLEHSQVLQTYFPEDRRGVTGGIAYELEQLEASHDTYPETIAFMKLLDALLDLPPPARLGQGYRVPGILPYIRFVAENVFTKLFARSYRSLNEQWDLASGCLSIFEKVVRVYTLPDSDFVEETVDVAGTPQPADKSPGHYLMSQLLRNESLLLTTLLRLLNNGVALLDEEPDSATPADSTLRLLVRLLSSTMLHQTAFLGRVLSSSFDVSFAPLDQQLLRTRQSIVDVARLIAHPDARLCLYAVRLIRLLANAVPSLTNILSEAQKAAKTIQAGFVDRLEIDDQTTPEADDVVEADGGSLQLAIIQLFLSALASSPSLAHFLLGVGPSAPPVLHACLPVVLRLLARPSLRFIQPILAESCYELVYKLCASRATSIATLQYLRTHDPTYFSKHLEYLETPLPEENRVHELYQRAWVYKTIALELHVTAGDLPQRTNAQRMLSVLFGPNAVTREADETLPESSSERMHMLQALDAFMDITQSDPPSLKAMAPTVDVEACRAQTPRGVAVFDVAALHRSLSAVAGAQSRDAANEMRSILHAAVAFNAFSELFCARFAALEGWRYLLGTALAEWPELLAGEAASAALLVVVASLLRKLLAPSLRSPLAAMVSEAVLAIFARLRDNKLRTSADEAPRLPEDLCLTLLRDLLAAVTHNSMTQQAARGNLYGALLHFLQYTGSDAPPSDGDHAFGDMQRMSVLESKVAMSLSSWGERLLSVVARDACDGGDVWQTAALAALTSIVAADGATQSVQILAHRGILRAIADIATMASPAATTQVFMAESAFAVLLRIAHSPSGASLLMADAVIPNLTSCRWLAAAPAAASEGRGLVLPALRLVAAMSTALPRNSDLAAQVLDLIKAHFELFETVLKGTQVITLNSLHELRAAAAILYVTAGHPTLVLEKLGPQARRLQDQIVTIMSRFAERDRWLANITPVTATERARNAQEWAPGTASDGITALHNDAISAATGACRNAVAFVRAVCDDNRVMFSPSMAQMSGTEALQAPPLSLLASFVRACSAQLITAVRAEGSLRFRLMHPSAAVVHLTALVTARVREISFLVYMLENGLTVLRQHLAVFLAPTTGLPTSVPPQQQEVLRRDAHMLLMQQLEELFKLETAAGRSMSFCHALVRRIRELLTPPAI